MNISGAAIIRNGVKYQFPFIESIVSVLPLCSEFIVAVGDSDDETRQKIEQLNDPRIKIIDTKWNLNNRNGGTVLSEQTNIALSACKGDWIFYIQSDEILHEKDYETIKAVLEYSAPRKNIEGIAFKYTHFYGSYFTVQSGRNWYQQEVRILRNNRGIVSHGDAQGFRLDSRKIRAVESYAGIYHYGWARPPQIMADKIKSFHRLWHDDDWIKEACGDKNAKEFFSDLGNLVDFTGTHPAAMKAAVNHDTEDFIKEFRKEYLSSRPFSGMIKDLIRRSPLGSHKNFSPVGKFG